MKFTTLRNIHLYLGCLFAPLLIFFLLTGSLQVFNLHEDKKDGYHAPRIVQAFAEAHKHQRWVGEDGWPTKESKEFRVFVVMMSAGLLLTLILGVVMALQVTKNPLLVILSMALGVLLPILFLFLP